MKEIFQYIISDYYRYTGKIGGVTRMCFYSVFGNNHCFRYTFWLRLASKKNILFPLAVVMRRYYQFKYGLDIPRTTKIGYGFHIVHGIGIVINGGTIIGNNVSISQFLSIGTNKRTPATIGDNVYLGPNVCVVEDVHIGNNVTIGAGAVVVKDIPDNATAVGVPAKVVNYDSPGKCVLRKWKIET